MPVEPPGEQGYSMQVGTPRVAGVIATHGPSLATPVSEATGLGGY